MYVVNVLFSLEFFEVVFTAMQIKMLMYLLEYFAIGCAPLFVVMEAASVLVFGPGYWHLQLGLSRSWDVSIFSFCIFSVFCPIGNIFIKFRARLVNRESLVKEVWNAYKCALNQLF